MVQELKNTPNTMVGFQLSDEVTRDEFDRLIFPAVDEVIKRAGTLNYLFVMDQSVQQFSFGKWLEESLNKANPGTIINRATVVIHPQFNFFMIDAVQQLMPGSVRVFQINELDAAINWASEQSDLVPDKKVFQEEDDRRE